MFTASWESRVRTWADDRNLIEGTTIEKQLLKLNEEVGELYEGVEAEDNAMIADAIGDCCVVLCNIAYKAGLSWEECLENAYNEIKDRKGRMVNGLYVKE
jgi:NTP pyrophosphatase (non-canonical NTP hydrolase)